MGSRWDVVEYRAGEPKPFLRHHLPTHQRLVYVFLVTANIALLRTIAICIPVSSDHLMGCKLSFFLTFACPAMLSS